jgi:hypothetical protein
MNEVTHRDTFRMHGIRYYECFKAASLWLNDIKEANHNESSDERILALAANDECPDSSDSDDHTPIGSIGDSEGSANGSM